MRCKLWEVNGLGGEEEETKFVELVNRRRVNPRVAG